MLQNLLEQLHNFLYLAIVEAVKRHDGELSNHVAEGREGLLFAHVQQEHCRNIGHALDIPIEELSMRTYPMSGLYMVKASSILCNSSYLSLPGRKTFRDGNVRGMSVSMMLMLFSLPRVGDLWSSSDPVMYSSRFFSFEYRLLSSISLIDC